ncbi:MAG: Asp-tRNA(Asn)/Glu-tRNA(Gln) amidotransferase subunit GatA [Desulfovibrio sp.]|nr:Asp-tRNA(Asn)/Glu-tRNA(Gln) amidotransferase subunit GatA [Desulfovibrio sp.]
MSELYYASLSDVLLRLQNKELSVQDVTACCLARIEATEPSLGALISCDKDNAMARAKALDKEGPDPAKPLWGIPVTIKDVITTKGLATTAGSRMLEHYVPTYDAFVTEKLRDAGCVILGKANMDEFAMGSATENSAYHPTHNPWNRDKVPGGSSGGSAASVASGQCFASLGTDTGGSIRQPASFCGCVGLKPTYGRVSRYGVIAYGSSLDQVGPLARNVEDCARVLSVIAGHDARDMTSSPEPVPDYLAACGARESLRGVRFGIPKEFFGEGMSSEVRETCEQAIALAEKAGATRVSVSLAHTNAAIATYYILAMAEASSNLARYDGVRYGYRASDAHELMDLYVRSRSEGLGQEVKRRIMLGAFVLSQGYYDAYFKRAAQVRRIIRDEYLACFNECDVLLAPVSPVTAWDIGAHAKDPLSSYLMDAYTLSLNLAGLPGLALPVGHGSVSKMPIGMQLIGPAFSEAALFSIASQFEKILPECEHPMVV